MFIVAQERVNVYRVFVPNGQSVWSFSSHWLMYIKFSLKHTQCIWSFGWHWPMYIKFWWRRLSTLFLWVGRRRMGIDLCALDPTSMYRIWCQLNRRNNSIAVIKCHFFTLRNFRATTFKRVTRRAVDQCILNFLFEVPDVHEVCDLYFDLPPSLCWRLAAGSS